MELAKDALAKEGEVSELGSSISTLEKRLSEARSLVETARERIEQESQSLRELTLLDKLRHYQSSIRALTSLKEAREKAAELRTQAGAMKDKARTFRSEVAALDLPTDDALRELAALERELEVAEAKVQIELSLLIRPLREIEISIDAGDRPHKPVRSAARRRSKPKAFSVLRSATRQISKYPEATPISARRQPTRDDDGRGPQHPFRAVRSLDPGRSRE